MKKSFLAILASFCFFNYSQAEEFQTEGFQTSHSQSQIEPYSHETFKRLIDFRVGSGEDKFFYTFGDVRAQPGGELLYHYEGVEICHLAPGSRTSTEATQLSRRIFFYIDPKTGEYIKEVDGIPIPPTKYENLIMERKLNQDKKVTIKGTQGVKPRVLSLDVLVPHLRRLQGNILQFPVNHFFAAGPYFFHEFGNYLSFPKYSTMAKKHTGAFVRLQPKSNWMKQASENVFLDLAMEDVKKFEALPSRLKDIIQQEYPLFQRPPKDLQECEDIQNGKIITSSP